MSDLRISFKNASADVEAVVREWFETRALPRKLDGDRSVRVAHPDFEGMELKIKGAGFRGGPIKYTQFHQSKLRAPIFDFDGRMMEDVASGHDNALVGGASFQQSCAEFRMSQFMQRTRVPHVKCTAYGKLETDEAASWFSLHDWDPRMIRVDMSSVSPNEFSSSLLLAGRQLLDFALRYNIVGNCAYAKRGDEMLFVDLHFFRQLDALNSSQISWAMHVIFNLHLIALDVMRFSKGEMARQFPPDVQAYPFRCALSDANCDDHEDLRIRVVAPYMLDRPKAFTIRELCAALRSNRISRSILDICPPEFERV